MSGIPTISEALPEADEGLTRFILNQDGFTVNKLPPISVLSEVDATESFKQFGEVIEAKLDDCFSDAISRPTEYTFLQASTLMQVCNVNPQINFETMTDLPPKNLAIRWVTEEGRVIIRSLHQSDSQLFFNMVTLDEKGNVASSTFVLTDGDERVCINYLTGMGSGGSSKLIGYVANTQSKEVSSLDTREVLNRMTE